MPPTKVQTATATTKNSKNAIIPLARRPISTRGHKNVIDGNHPLIGGKRKADASPLKNEKVKRSALGNLTNAVLNYIDDSKKSDKSDASQKIRDALTLKKTTQSNGNTLKASSNQQNIKPKSNGVQGIDSLFPPPNMIAIQPPRQTKVMTRAASRASQPPQLRVLGTIENAMKATSIATTIVKPKKKSDQVNANNNNSNNNNPNKNEISDEKRNPQKPSTRRISNEFDLNENEDSHYVSALEDFSSSSTAFRLSMSSLESVAIGDARRKSCASTLSDSNDSMYTISNQSPSHSTITSSQSDTTLSQEVATISDPKPVPDGVIDFDRENWDDPLQASHYAMDIFNYLKDREQIFKIDPYMQRQPHLTSWMRTLLVDWMVEVQETFELNHETLYLAVKIVDIYLSKVTVHKEKLQLLGAAALFMACKYDERTPPLIDDFLYICDGAYVQTELTRMEMNVFRTIGYDLGIPLSYRFLRRFARCAKVAMPELTLARYILEFSLMNYDVITLSDSKLASACLFMALRMNNKTGWNKTLEYYTGYKLSEFETIVPMLNASLHQKQRDANKTVRNKYAHKIFFEVSKVPLLTNDKLFEQTGSYQQS